MRSLTSLQEYKALLDKTRKCTKAFRKSGKAKKVLFTQQKLLNTSESVPPIDCVTRWNSTFAMVDFMVTNRTAMGLTIPILNAQKIGSFRTSVLPFSEQEMKSLSQLVDVLKPVAEATAPLSGSQYVTISVGYPLVRGVLHETKSLEEKIPLDSPIKPFAQRLVQSIAARFSACSSTETIAFVLDPRFKKAAESDAIAESLGAAWELERQSLNQAQAVENEVKEIKVVEAKAAAPPAAMNHPLEKLRSLFGLGVPEPPKPREPELQRYIQRESALDVSGDPLKWWCERQADYPVLSRMARRYLCIQASSVACERVWSTAGNIITNKRNRLLANALEAIIIIHENYSRLQVLLAPKEEKETVKPDKRPL